MAKSEPAIKKDLALIQKKILHFDHDAKKQSAIVAVSRKEFEEAAEIREILVEKRNIMHTTYATLKRDIHTRK